MLFRSNRNCRLGCPIRQKGFHVKKTIDEQGFTLVELMISIALLSLVLIMAYQFLYHGQTTTNRTQEKWLAERDVKNVSRVITQAIQLSYAATLSQNPLSETDKEFKNGKMFYFSAGDGTKGDLQFTDFKIGRAHV